MWSRVTRGETSNAQEEPPPPSLFVPFHPVPYVSTLLASGQLTSGSELVRMRERC